MIFVQHEKDVKPADLSTEHDLKGVELRPLITEKEGAKHFAMRLFRLEPGSTRIAGWCGPRHPSVSSWS